MKAEMYSFYLNFCDQCFQKSDFIRKFNFFNICENTLLFCRNSTFVWKPAKNLVSDLRILDFQAFQNLLLEALIDISSLVVLHIMQTVVKCEPLISTYLYVVCDQHDVPQVLQKHKYSKKELHFLEDLTLVLL